MPDSEQNLGNPAGAGEAEPQRQGQSRVVSAVAGECRGDPHPQASSLVRLLGEGQAPEEMGRSHAARPHLLVCGMWGPCRVLSPTPTGSASVTSLRTGMKPSSPLLSWLSLHQEIQQGTSSSGLASSCPISGAWPPGNAPGRDESGRGPGRPRCRLRRGQGVLPWGSMGTQLR